MDSPLREGWETRYLLEAPPDLTAEIAARRWREVNLLVRSPLLLQGRAGVGKTLPAVLHLARSIVAAGRGLLSLWDEPPGTLEIAADFGFGSRLPDRLRRDNPMAAAAVRRRKPILVGRVDDVRIARELGLPGRSSCLSVPILSQGAPWGVIQLIRPEPFTEEDGVLLWLYALILEGALSGLAQCDDSSWRMSAAPASGRSV